MNPDDASWLDRLGPGAWSHLGVALAEGARVREGRDHLVVHTPGNPACQHGNYVELLEPADAEDPGQALAAYLGEMPPARHRAFGLRHSAPPVWLDYGLRAASSVVLTRTGRARPTTDINLYDVRPLADPSDWQRSVELTLSWAEQNGLGSIDRAVVRRRAHARAALVRDGRAYFVGAFAGERLVSQCGVVSLGQYARYQAIFTQPGYRRRGLAAQLIGLCGRWAADSGATTLILLTDPANPARQLYCDLGFAAAGMRHTVAIDDWERISS